MEKRKLKHYTSYDLLEIAVEAVKNDVTDTKNFKKYFNVNFTFLQLCSLLTHRKIFDKTVMTKTEYEKVRAATEKTDLIRLLNEVKTRNTFLIDDLNHLIP